MIKNHDINCNEKNIQNNSVTLDLSLPRVNLSIIGFFQGIFSATGIIYFHLYNDINQLGFGIIFIIQALSLLPWLLRPFQGYFIDKSLISGLRFKTTLIFSALIEIVVYTILFNMPTNQFIIVSMSQIQLSMVMCLKYIAYESQIVSAVEKKRATLNDKELYFFSQSSVSAQFGFRGLGKFLGSWLTSVLINIEIVQMIFLFCAILSTLETFVIISFMNENNFAGERSNIITIKAERKKIWNTLKNKKIKFSLMVIQMMTLIPEVGSQFFVYMNQHLDFEPVYIGLIHMIRLLVFVLQLVFINVFMGKQSFKCMTITCGISKAQVNLCMFVLTVNMVPNETLKYVISIVLATLSGISSNIIWIPVIAFAVRFCPRGLQATTTSIVSTLAFLSTGFTSQMENSAFKLLRSNNLANKNYEYKDLWRFLAMQMFCTQGLVGFILYLKFPKYRFAPINAQAEESEIKMEDCICDDELCQDDIFTEECSIAVDNVPEIKPCRSLPGELVNSSPQKNILNIPAIKGFNFKDQISSPRSTKPPCKSQREINFDHSRKK